MPFCRECGKEVQEDWNSCPYCNISTGTATVQNKVIDVQKVVIEPSRTLWNVVIVAITLGIIFWPHGIFEITLLDRATTDCAVLDSTFFESLENPCEEWKTEGIIYLVVTIMASSLLLLITNKIFFINDNIDDDKNDFQEVLFAKIVRYIALVTLAIFLGMSLFKGFQLL